MICNRSRPYSHSPEIEKAIHPSFFALLYLPLVLRTNWPWSDNVQPIRWFALSMRVIDHECDASITSGFEKTTSIDPKLSRWRESKKTYSIQSLRQEGCSIPTGNRRITFLEKYGFVAQCFFNRLRKPEFPHHTSNADVLIQQHTFFLWMSSWLRLTTPMMPNFTGITRPQRTS